MSNFKYFSWPWASIPFLKKESFFIIGIHRWLSSSQCNCYLLKVIPLIQKYYCKNRNQNRELSCGQKRIVFKKIYTIIIFTAKHQLIKIYLWRYPFHITYHSMFFSVVVIPTPKIDPKVHFGILQQWCVKSLHVPTKV